MLNNILIKKREAPMNDKGFVIKPPPLTKRKNSINVTRLV